MALQRMLAAAPLLSAIRARRLHIGKLTVNPVVSVGKTGYVMPLAELLPLDAPTAPRLGRPTGTIPCQENHKPAGTK
jgi:hypothetical protein